MKQVLSRIAVMIMAVAATLGMGAAPALASEEEGTEPALEVTVHTDKDTYSIGEEITYTIEVTQTAEGVTAPDVFVASKLPDEIHVKAVALSGVDGEAGAIHWKEGKAEVPYLIPVGQTDGKDITDLEIQFKFADGIIRPNGLTIGFEVITEMYFDEDGLEVPNYAYYDYFNLEFSPETEWRGVLKDVPLIEDADYIIWTWYMESELYELGIDDKFEIYDIEGSVAEGVTCTLDSGLGNYCLTKIPELSYGETATIAVTATAESVSDNVINIITAGADKATGSFSKLAETEASVNIVEAGAAVAEDDGTDNDAETQTAQENQGTAETGAAQDSNTTDIENTTSEATTENVEGEVVDINDESAVAELYDDEEWEDDVTLMDEGVDDTTAVQTGEGHAAAFATIIGCAAAALALTVIARKRRTFS